MKRIAIVIGTRPEAIKQLPVVAATTRAEGLEPVVIDTGQHREMLRQILHPHGIVPDHELDVMLPNQSLEALTARLVEGLGALFREHPVDFCVVQGDTTTALSGALAAFYNRVPVGHVEAGLRTGRLDAPFPEEGNRRLVTAIARLHFAPTEASRQALLREAVDPASIVVTGNTVVDALELEIGRQRQDGVVDRIRHDLAVVLGDGYWRGKLVLVTGHRRESFGRGFQEICDALLELSQRLPEHTFVYPVHLNPNVRGPVHERLAGRANIKLIAPLEYSYFVRLMAESCFILTDSGGVQEEAPSLDKPVLVMRDATERTEGLIAGTALLVGTHREQIVESALRVALDGEVHASMAAARNPFGDGRAGERIATALQQYFTPDGTGHPGSVLGGAPTP